MVFMDINLPIMNGFDATIEIKQFRKDLPVIMQTAFVFLRNKCFEIGCDDFICKPYRKDAVLEMIDKYVLKKKSKTSF